LQIYRILHICSQTYCLRAIFKSNCSNTLRLIEIGRSTYWSNMAR
jgi:hypothetical protein